MDEQVAHLGLHLAELRDEVEARAAARPASPPRASTPPGVNPSGWAAAQHFRVG